ncbi:hypothetical protein [Nostoc sp. DedQUE09]|uniref:hypothetical protein n=1 Tax=Nostoc sp. DedQUE09 TaxID=3075394 RepID=UPI002AD4CEF6|nr:hypothetical protein [Nostoc sp. DedQUE09]MDZ7951111.1 hypothetical protein [Nostoc sp. DedQUE09]
MALGQNKPNGLTVILPEEAIAFVEQLPIEKFHGIEEVTGAKMHSLGIHSGADLKVRSLTARITFSPSQSQCPRRLYANT